MRADGEMELPDLGPDYEVMSALGRGGFGAVYLALDQKMGHRLAVKVFFDPGHFESLRREFQSVVRVHSRNTVQVRAYGKTRDGRPWIAYDYYMGSTLRQRLDEGRLPLDEALEILDQIAEGVGAIHDAGIIHRDLKPDNIMLTRDEQRRVLVKVMDFGIARIVDRTKKEARQSMFLGAHTPGYAPPEYLNPDTMEEAVRPSFDMFSLGAIAYEALSGRRAFEDDVRQCRPRPLASVAPQLKDAPSLGRLVATCLGVDPDRRGSARQFRESLAQAGRELAQEEPRPRRPWIAILVVLVVAGVLSVALWVVLGGRDPSDPGEVSPTPGVGVGVDTKDPVLTVDSVGRDGWVAAPVTLTGTVEDATTVTLTVAGASVPVGPDGRWTASPALGAGMQMVIVVATNAGGRRVEQTVDLRVDVKPPEVKADPVATRTRATEVSVRATVTDDGDVVAVSIGRKAATRDGAVWTATVPLGREGENVIPVVARDAAGRETTASVTVERDTTPPVVGITSPGENADVEPGALTVRGTVDDVRATVTVNGAPASVKTDRTWTCELKGFSPTLRIEAEDDLGNRAIPVTRKLRVVLSPTMKVPAWATAVAGTTADEGGWAKEVAEKKTGMVMVLIPSGEFDMGSPETEESHESDEGPVHRVTISRPFYLGKFEVTQGEWEPVMGSNPSSFKKGDRFPVENVSWSDAREFLKKLDPARFAADWPTSGPPDGFRLPSEAEWEYACRAGTKTPFHFGPAISPEQANYDGNYAYGGGPKGVYRQSTIAVGSFPANAWGLRDVHGNVWEWCDDAYEVEAYRMRTPIVTDPHVSPGASRVIRGGSWYGYPRYCRAAFRFRGDPTNTRYVVGFRAARTPFD